MAVAKAVMNSAPMFDKKIGLGLFCLIHLPLYSWLTMSAFLAQLKSS